MSVLAAFVPNSGIQAFQNNVLRLTPTVDVVGVRDTGIFVHISGTTERAMHTLVGSHARDIAVVFYRDKPGTEFPGVEGHGIPNQIEAQGRIMDVQGGTLSVADLARKPNR